MLRLLDAEFEQQKITRSQAASCRRSVPRLPWIKCRKTVRAAHLYSGSYWPSATY